MSIVFATSIGMYGFFLGMTGTTRTIEWSFFFASAALLFLWKPRLDDATGSPENVLSDA